MFTMVEFASPTCPAAVLVPDDTVDDNLLGAVSMLVCIRHVVPVHCSSSCVAPPPCI